MVQSSGITKPNDNYLRPPCLLAIVVAIFTSCTDYGTSPKTYPVHHENYRLYAGNWGYDEVYVVNTDSEKVIDTLRGFGSVWDLALTKGGTKLYVTTRQGLVNTPGAVYSVDLMTKSKRQILAQPADIYVEPDGTPLIFASSPYDSLRHVGIIDTIGDAVSFFDNLDIRDSGSNYEAVAFSSAGSIFYTVNNQSNVVAYDYALRKMVRYYKNHGEVLNIAISKDNTSLFCTVYGDILIVLDIVHDTILASARCNALGSLAVSPTQDFLYVTDPGKYILPEPVPSGKIGIFQLMANAFTGFIDVNGASGQPYTITDRMVITPDGTTAYVGDSISRIFTIDLVTNQVIHLLSFQPHNIAIRPLALDVK